MISYIQGFEKIIKQTCFSYFLCGFKIKSSDMHEHVMNNQEYVMNNQEHVKNT